MKKLNILFYVIGIICFIVAFYIIYDEFFVDDEININFNEDEELLLLNDKLVKVGSSLGYIIIRDSIDSTGNYSINYGKDLLDNYHYRQLFTMEYILSYNNYDSFIVLDISGNVIEDIPTSKSTISYVNYDYFNDYYKELFGEDFDLTRAKKGNTSYDNDYVYYENIKEDTSGIYVPMIKAISTQYEDGIYSAYTTITYSTGASSIYDVYEDNALLKYTKDINGNINFKSFVLER